jgi:hypothetical protein
LSKQIVFIRSHSSEIEVTVLSVSRYKVVKPCLPVYSKKLEI